MPSYCDCEEEWHDPCKRTLPPIDLAMVRVCGYNETFTTLR